MIYLIGKVGFSLIALFPVSYIVQAVLRDMASMKVETLGDRFVLVLLGSLILLNFLVLVAVCCHWILFPN